MIERMGNPRRSLRSHHHPANRADEAEQHYQRITIQISRSASGRPAGCRKTQRQQPLGPKRSMIPDRRASRKCGRTRMQGGRKSGNYKVRPIPFVEEEAVIGAKVVAKRCGCVFVADTSANAVTPSPSSMRLLTTAFTSIGTSCIACIKCSLK
jgi:hypothetical protein